MGRFADDATGMGSLFQKTRCSVLRVYRFAGLAATILLTACLAVTAQPPEKKGPPDEKGGQGKGGFGKGGQGKGFGGGMGGGFGMGQPGQILPTFLQDMLKLSDDQKKQVADIQKDVDTKLDKILTDDQKKQLKDMRNRGPGGFGGGPGGPGGFGGPGGPPKDGPPKKDK